MRQKCLTDTPSHHHSIDTAPTVDVLRMAVYCPESIATDNAKATDLWYANCPHRAKIAQSTADARFCRQSLPGAANGKPIGGLVSYLKPES